MMICVNSEKGKMRKKKKNVKTELYNDLFYDEIKEDKDEDIENDELEYDDPDDDEEETEEQDEDIETEPLFVKTKETDKKDNHYVDNAKFYKEIKKWKDKIKKAEMCGEKNPPVTSYIGECILSISERLSRRPNFINYPFREEMIGDGVENCLMYAHNFDPDKSKNPFSYFTQIIYYAFLRRIEKEKKQAYIKYKLIEQSDDVILRKWFLENYGSDHECNVKDAIIKHASISEADIAKYEPTTKKKTKTKKKK